MSSAKRGAGTVDALRTLIARHAQTPALFEEAPEAMALFDRDGAIVARNAVALELFGPPEGRHLRDRLVVDATLLDRYLERALGGKPTSFETTACPAHGQPLPVEIILRPAILEGEVVGVYGTLRNRSAEAHFEHLMAVALQESRSLFEQCPDPIAELGIDARYLRVNAAFHALTGFTHEEVTSESFSALHLEDEVERAHRTIATVVESGEAMPLDVSIRTRDGRRLLVEARIVPKIVDGDVTGVFAIGREVTELRRLRAAADEHLRRIEALYAIITSTAPSREQVDRALTIAARRLGCDFAYVGRVADGVVTIRNTVGDPAFTQRFPIGATIDLNHSLASRVLEADDVVALDHLEGLIWANDGENPGVEWSSFIGARLDVEGGLFGVIGFASSKRRAEHYNTADATFVRFAAALAASAIGRERRERRLGDLALRDPLTGLANRRGANDAIAEELADAGAATRAAVLYVDLDHFKPVNDALGHEAGDAVLRAVARRLRDLSRISDVVARFGGDEFVLLQRASDPSKVRAFGERIVRALADPIELNGQEVSIGASVGAAIARDGESVEAILRRADRALYAAKSAGRGIVVVD